MSQVRDLLGTRTVVIRFPDGNSEYWLTDQVFRRGETLTHLDQVWLISDVLGPADTGGYAAVSLRPADEAAA